MIRIPWLESRIEMPILVKGGAFLENVNVKEAAIYDPEGSWHWWLMAYWRAVLLDDLTT